MEMKTSPVLLTSTGLLGSTKAVLMNQGRPRHSMSKTLEPTMLDMAMSAFPDEQKTLNVLNSYILDLSLFTQNFGIQVKKNGKVAQQSE